jgi:hypothetical protein
MIRSRVFLTAASAVLFGVVAVGCQSDGGTEGEVVSRSQDQDVRPDGTAVQTRSQVRQTPDGTTVRETQTQERQVLPAGSGDATQSSPAR